MKRASLALLTALVAAAPAFAQALPRISSLYPPGAQAGQTVEVSIRGGGLEGAREVIVDGPGLSAKLNESNVKVDAADQKVFTAKCGLCHELRGPATISRTADQWIATVDRMIRDRGAPIEPADRTKIVNYVTAAARAAAGLTARVTLAADAAPGRREIRVVGANGTSTAFPFEVSRQSEALEVEPNNAVDKAPVVTFPLTVSGQLTTSDQDCFAFTAKKGERLVFNCSAFRLNPSSQGFFFPVLYLYDEKGKELAKNTGYFSLDPLIDWTAPADGKYVIAVRDMLYRGSPSSVYRLSMGSLPYKTYLFPPGGKRGTTVEATLNGENMPQGTVKVTLDSQGGAGVRLVRTDHGVFPFVAGDEPEMADPSGGVSQPLTFPVAVNGRIDAEGSDRFTFTLTKEQLGTYSFELFAHRIGSPVVGRLTLQNNRGQSLVTNNGTAGSPDARIDYNFTREGEYTLLVQNDANQFSPAHVYRLRATASAPDFQVAISPDNPNLGPGSSLYMPIRILKRVGITGNIELSFPKLPEGVTATATTIRPDQNQAFVVLTAGPNAKPGSYSLADVVARTTVNGTTLERPVLPYEVYLINNNQQLTPRGNLVVTVGPEAGWSAAVEPGAMQMAADGSPIEVKVRLNRTAADRDMPFAIVGVPQGIQAPGSLLFRKGQNEMTFTMRPSMQGVLTPRREGPSSLTFYLAVVNGREGEGMQMSSPPVPVTVTIPAAK